MAGMQIADNRPGYYNVRDIPTKQNNDIIITTLTCIILSFYTL